MNFLKTVFSRKKNLLFRSLKIQQQIQRCQQRSIQKISICKRHLNKKHLLMLLNKFKIFRLIKINNHYKTLLLYKSIYHNLRQERKKWDQVFCMVQLMTLILLMPRYQSIHLQECQISDNQINYMEHNLSQHLLGLLENHKGLFL